MTSIEKYLYHHNSYLDMEAHHPIEGTQNILQGLIQGDTIDNMNEDKHLDTIDSLLNHIQDNEL